MTGLPNYGGGQGSGRYGGPPTSPLDIPVVMLPGWQLQAIEAIMPQLELLAAKMEEGAKVDCPVDSGDLRDSITAEVLPGKFAASQTMFSTSSGKMGDEIRARAVRNHREAADAAGKKYSKATKTPGGPGRASVIKKGATLPHPLEFALAAMETTGTGFDEPGTIVLTAMEEYGASVEFGHATPGGGHQPEHPYLRPQMYKNWGIL